MFARSRQKPIAYPDANSGRETASGLGPKLLFTKRKQAEERDSFMRQRGITIPEIMLIGGTRVALGVGLGLLLSDKLSRDVRKGAGWTLFALGVLSTVPLVMDILGKPQLGPESNAE